VQRQLYKLMAGSHGHAFLAYRIIRGNRLFPVVGVPSFSYGGTSMITSMVGIAILLNIGCGFMF
jgi:cell division protein FtsW (lipid II flippase)